MKKKLLSLAIAAVMAPAFATAAEVSGFADITYTLKDDTYKPATGTHPTEGKFAVNGEVNFTASPVGGVTVRVDVDLNIGGSATSLGTSNGANYTALNDLFSGSPYGAAAGPAQGPADSGVIEQAFFAWGVTEGVTVIGGVFNNPIGQDAQDKPDMAFASHSQIYTLLDDQTALYDNNVTGLAVAGKVGPATVTVGLLNDLQQTNDKNSVAVLVNYSPMKGLDLELGTVSQANQTDTNGLSFTTGSSVENITNFNVSYSPEQIAGLAVGLDYATFGKIVDSSHDLWATYKMDKFGVGARLSNTEFKAGADWDTTTIDVSYQAASNLKIVLENRSDKLSGSTVAAANRTDTTTFLNLVAKF